MQWHPTVALDDFVRQVACFVEIVDMTRTAKLSLFDCQTIKRAMGWGSYIEEVSRKLSNFHATAATYRIDIAFIALLGSLSGVLAFVWTPSK